MKKIALSFLSIALLLTTCFSQHTIDKPASYMYFGQYLTPQLRLNHAQKYQGQFAQFNDDFVISMTFVIDTSGSPKNIRVKSNSLPSIVVDYLTGLINDTKRRWQPEIKSCTIVESDIIYCTIFLDNKKITPEMRGDRITKQLEEDYKSDAPYEVDTNDMFNAGKINHIHIHLEY
jgi:ribosomal protein L28